MAIHLIRHALAGKRRNWSGPDEARPLSARGVAQARALGEVLAGEGIDLLWTSPFLRCAQTLEPLADRLKLPIEAVDVLAEGARGVLALDALLDAAGRGHTVAASSHGDVIPEIIDEAVVRGARLDGPTTPRKGARYELWVSSGRVERIVHLAAPARSAPAGRRG